ncbi:hypothetical protein [Acidobacterium capsulatum]|uniref:Antitoxin Xre/MbcA/ParS-like toxin-binding domain-containing protein n=2 Tax=Acidobacterium TaxID=33973 RepID=C1F6M9_ACIC5|nr:hypothetical protein [Acidobacterium capsulatum]ACO33362.1 conserved hypothetical protein [Acidobacterium capsulatum ATCC 51196]
MAHASQLLKNGPEVLVGTGSEVSRRLNRSSARRAIAVTFTDDDEQSAVLEDVVRKTAKFLPHIVRQRQQESLERIVGALLPDIAIPDAALAQARMLVDAKATILRSGDFLPAGEIAKLAGYSDKNPSAQPNKWKKDGTIFAIRHKGVDYFPLYALDPDENYRPYKAVAKVLHVLGAAKTGWETAFWFAGLNSFLDDRRPQDLLASDPDNVIAAAKDEVEGVQHG